MSKKDYILLAKALENVRPEIPAPGVFQPNRVMWDKVVIEIAQTLGRENARFDLHRFIDATEGRWTAAQRRNA